jgi:hypothetical protein
MRSESVKSKIWVSNNTELAVLSTDLQYVCILIMLLKKMLNKKDRNSLTYLNKTF